MKPRIPSDQIAPAALKALYGVEHYVRSTNLEKSLVHLVKLVASHQNRCAYCVDMHTKDARAAGETEQRLYSAAVWRETPFYTPRERAALAWTEAVTQVGASGVPDAVYEEVLRHFDQHEIVDLTMTVLAINLWNRWAVSLRAVPGSYEPKASAPAA